MNLLVQQLKAAIDDLARRKGIVGARVLDKLNQHGEVVIALILPRRDGSSGTSKSGEAGKTGDTRDTRSRR